MGKEEVAPQTPRNPETAKRFFTRAAEVALTGNHDYAMDLYRDGIKWDPDALETGHKPLRDVGLKRKLGGGKPGGLRDQAAFRRANDPNEKVAWAAYLLAKEPDNIRHMEALVSAAQKAEASETARWAAIMLVEANRDSARPQLDRYMLAVDALEQFEVYDQAVAACQYACRLKQNDGTLLTRLKNLSAMQTMKKGKYQTASDFKDSLDNAKRQMDQQEDQRVVSTDDIMDRQVAEARRDMQNNPTVAGKVFTLVDILAKRGREAEENEAIAVLQQAYDTTKSYRFRERIGEIRMRQYHRKAAQAAQALHADPNNAELRKAAQQIAREARAVEEQEYAERVANYPTDLTLKFEYGRRLFANGKFEQAVPVLQQAESDPKNRLRAKSLLGQSFFRLGFYNESVDTFRRAIGDLEIGGTDTAKELHYHLGRALEEMGKTAEADAAYSQVMQWDFNYQDVRQRLQRLRNPPAAGGQSAAPSAS